MTATFPYLARSVPVEPFPRIFSRRTQLPLPSNLLWQVDSGVIRTFTWLEDGSLVTLGLWGAGDIIGRTLSTANPYHAICLSEVQVTPVFPEQWGEMTNALIEHTRRSNELVEILHCPQTEVALLRALNWIAQRFGQQIPQGRQINVRITHQELAELIGATRVTVTRILNDFEKRGLISRQQRCITVMPEAYPFWHYEI
jgi:CRP-like cAMP-binding protein